MKALPAEYGDLPGIIETSGRMKAFDEVIISAEVGGRLGQGSHLFNPVSGSKKENSLQ